MYVHHTPPRENSAISPMYEAILSLETVEECRNFLEDLCTIKEIQAMEQRYMVAKLLDNGLIYNDILVKTGASSATISRVNRSLNYGANGYRIVFDRLKNNSSAPSSYESLAQWYDVLTQDVPYTDFAEFYIKLFRSRKRPVATVLDLACGTGTISFKLAGAGYEVIAVDMSSDMLAAAQAKLYEAPESIIPPLFLCQDITGLDLYGTVDAAVCSLDAINYIHPEKLGAVFHRLRLFIEPGGLLIFDIQSPEKLKSLGGVSSIDEAPGVYCIWRGDYDNSRQMLNYAMDIFTKQGGAWQRSFEEHLEYAHEPEQIFSLLKDEGFTDIEIQPEGPQSDDGRIHISAVRGE